MNSKRRPLQDGSFRSKVHEIIFESHTFWGKAFDVSLLMLIAISIVTLMLESVDSINQKYEQLFNALEWVLTLLFSLEYIFRLYATKQPMRYAKSFYGVIDLAAILPSFLEIFISGSHYFLIFRTMRLLRIFRIFKLVRFIDEKNSLAYSLKQSWHKISYFLFFVLISVSIIGTVMYLIEGGENPGFSNIPQSIYWAIVTLTTVGYGDVSPITPLGKFLASTVMILGYSVLAVPTGIVTAEMTKQSMGEAKKFNGQVCQNCSEEEHLPDAEFCHKCGEAL